MTKDTQAGSSSAPAVAIRALHMDLKGVPPTHHRLLGLVELAAAAKYNAILVEWEDMFPWTVDSRFRCETAYTPAQVRAFHDAALKQGLEIIPLVQCLGHMETPLSVSDYKHLREVPYRSDGLDPLAKGARELVERMIDDVLALSPGVRYFHLGGDEARTLGMNPQTAAYVKAHGKGQLYLQHVEPILDRLAGRNIRPILWSDMFHDWPDADIRHIASKADLCPWGYGGNPDDWQYHSATKYIKRFHQNGAALWGATAYKGASAHNADLCDFAQQQENALAWTDVAKRFAMKGLIATAWSRFSTDRTQTQPIDACLDSLVNVGLILHKAKAPGQDACMEILRQTCDDARLTACKAAMSKLAQLRQWAWSAVGELREQIVLETADPRRRESGMAMSFLIDLKRHMEVGGPEAYSMARAAFAGLIEPIWIERYLQERIEPLMEELGSLDSRVRVLEPHAYKAAIQLRSWNQAH
jgi:hexosaminidase